MEEMSKEKLADDTDPNKQCIKLTDVGKIYFLDYELRRLKTRVSIIEFATIFLGVATLITILK